MGGAAQRCLERTSVQLVDISVLTWMFVVSRETVPFAALLLPSCQRLMPLLALPQAAITGAPAAIRLSYHVSFCPMTL